MSPPSENTEAFRVAWKRATGNDLTVEAAEVELRELVHFLRWLLAVPTGELSTAGRLTDGSLRSENENEDS